MQIKNRFASFVFDKFDAPIRFSYCKLGFVSKIFNKFLFWKLYSSNFIELDRRFEKMYECILKNNINLKDKVILELGPGNSYINAYNFLLKGSKKVILIDKFPRQIKTKKQQKYFLDEIDYIKNKYKIDNLFFLDQSNNIKSEYVAFISKDLVESDIEIGVDFIYSISVFEHIKKIAENIKKLAEILVPGGYMYHHIDLRDHYNFNSPFLFYKYSDYAWNKYLTKEGVSYTNRWRYNDYVKAFADNGLSLVNSEIENFSIEQIKINPMFFGKNLECGIADVLLKK